MKIAVQDDKRSNIPALANPHAILGTLAGKRIRGRLLAWLRDYLQHRLAQVKFQGHKSSFREL
ncbi:hypothetical protein E2C01_058955 [Portunus trituberculatus]|uniref:Uncharacterized protein n=1 Tax=Portunus trituberculatus TaxID=210409 RepID=A0A5B7H7R8_PORTR|nr:hypothetical protein [Portunus trituberculatus]